MKWHLRLFWGFHNQGQICETAHIRTPTHCCSGIDYFFSSCWSVGLRLPQTSQVIAIVLGYPPELEGKISLLKNPHSSVIEHVDIRLTLIWKLCSYWLPFRVPEFMLHGNKIIPQFYPAVKPENYNNNWSGKISQLVQQWHEFTGANTCTLMDVQPILQDRIHA